MRKVLLLMILAVFVGMGLAAQTAAAQEKKEEKKVAKTEEVRWRGTLMIVDTDASTLTVRNKAGVDKIIHFSSATQWTKGKDVIELSGFKTGAHVLCLGKYDEKGAFHATRVDLRYVP
jgi:pyruvate/2-oxoglutarate dehydrogenase complex dihydrolipoamide dehydrogenase (E3) component